MEGAQIMKFLILGATGMAGHTISLYLQKKGHEVTTFSSSRFPFCRNINGDATNQELMKKILIEEDFNVVINCIGVLNKVCDESPSNAVYLNSYLPHFIADTIKTSNKRLIQMSTDCVFAGNTGPYNEKSFRDGATFYDRTKALGEVDDNKNLTFRNSIIGPDTKPEGIGLFNWFMKQDGEIEGYTHAIWTGVTTLTLAKAMEQAAKEQLTGIYNLVNNKSISKFELLNLFNKYFKDNRVTIEPNSHLKLDKTLISNRTDFDFKVPEYEQMIVEMRDWVFANSELYPHYYTSGKSKPGDKES